MRGVWDGEADKHKQAAKNSNVAFVNQGKDRIKRLSWIELDIAQIP